MVDTFERLGILSELATAAHETGWVGPSRLQADAVPVIRRGNNVILHASAGAGTTGAYGLGVLDRMLSPEDAGQGLRVLVLVPELDTASRVAESLARLAADTGGNVRALAPGWRTGSADVLVASPNAAVSAIRESLLKIDSLVSLVVDGADQMAATGQWNALETVMETTPQECQRILVTGRFDDTVSGFIERHVRKAMTIPPRPTEVSDETDVTGTTVRYLTLPPAEKTAAAVALIEMSGAVEAAVICRDPQRAERLVTELRARGIEAGDRDAEAAASGQARVLVLPRLEADRRTTRAEVISYDVPFDAISLADLHERGGAVLVAPRELAHLRRIAARAGTRLEAARLPASRMGGPSEAIRDRLRETVRQVDLAADLALIEPLLDELPPAELAAAAVHIARMAGNATNAGPPGRPTESAPAARPGTTAPAAPPPSDASWVRLFVSAGERDGLSPGDLVGAITGETDLKGAEVGKIEIRESHSTVEVPKSAAEAVIKALNGRSLRGRSMRVDYDRKDRDRGQSRAAARSGPRPDRPPRGGSGPRGGVKPRGSSGRRD